MRHEKSIWTYGDLCSSLGGPVQLTEYYCKDVASFRADGHLPDQEFALKKKKKEEERKKRKKE